MGNAIIFMGREKQRDNKENPSSIPTSPVDSDETYQVHAEDSKTGSKIYYFQSPLIEFLGTYSDLYKKIADFLIRANIRDLKQVKIFNGQLPIWVKNGAGMKFVPKVSEAKERALRKGVEACLNDL